MMSVQRVAELAKLAPRQIIYKDPRFPPSIYYRFMKLLAQEIHPKLSVVLGVCGGGDCLYLASGYSEGMVYGVDYADDHPDNIKHIKDNFSNFRYLLDDSIGVLEHCNFGVPVDILFIDTIHTYERTMQEFGAWQPMLNPAGAIVMLDDLFRDGMQRAWDELPGTKIRLNDLHIGGAPTDGGFGVILL